MNTRYLPNSKILDSRFRELEPEIGALGFVRGMVRAVNEELRTVEMVISSGERDRYGEIVDPAAFDKETIALFMTNPVMLAGHRHIAPNGEPTIIGHWLSITRDGDKVVGVCKVATTPLAQLYWQLLLDGSLRACSIGFLVREWIMRELGSGNDKVRVRVFTKIELLEISLCAVPANRQALMKAAGFDDFFLRGGEPVEGELLEAAELDYEKLAAALAPHLCKVLTDPVGPVDALMREVIAAYSGAGSVGHHHDASPNGSASDDLEATLRRMAGV